MWLEFRQQVATFLFDIGHRFPWKDTFSVVEEWHYTGIPSNRPNLYLLIEIQGSVLRILANISHTEITNPQSWEIWLSAQKCENSNEKYGNHLPLHGFYTLDDTQAVIQTLDSVIEN